MGRSLKRKRECLLKCSDCSKTFRDKFGLNRHSKVHDVNSASKRLKVCSLCFLPVQDLVEHLVQAHGVIIEAENLFFSDFKEFEDWKEKLEQETKSRYVRHSGSNKRKDGSYITYYYCHRDGNYTPKGRNIRNLKVIGSNKMNAGCPSLIKVEHNIKGLSVLFRSTHVGHTCDAGRMVLTKSLKDKIAEKVNMNMPLEEILDEMKNAVPGDELQRIHLTSKQDIRNIITQYGLENVQKKDDLEMRKRCEIKRITGIIEGIQTKSGFLAYKKFIAPLDKIIKNADSSEELAKDTSSHPRISNEPQKIILCRNMFFHHSKKKNINSFCLKDISQESSQIAIQFITDSVPDTLEIELGPEIENYG